MTMPPLPGIGYGPPAYPDLAPAEVRETVGAEEACSSPTEFRRYLRAKRTRFGFPAVSARPRPSSAFRDRQAIIW